MGNSLFLTSILSMAGLAFLFAAILAFADKKLRIKEDPRVEELTNLLPGINCGACGFKSCHDFAEHIVTEGADPGKCRVVDEETREKLFALMGEAEGTVYKYIPVIHCAAEWKNKKNKAEYKGIKTCGAANLNFGSGLECQYGCMGFGDCTEVCPFDALHMVEGLPRVDQKKCTGCGKCAEACPRNIITMEEKRNDVLIYIACSSHDNTLRTRQVCDVGCIACGICDKLSQGEFFKVVDNLSVPDYTKQTSERIEKIRDISSKCPTKVIKEM